jgi:hypothetical protein
MIRRRFVLLAAFLAMAIISHAQIKSIQGIVEDKQSDEPIPYSTLIFKLSGRGALTDSAGKFFFPAGEWSANDTLEINNIGYKKIFIPVSYFKDSTFATIKIEVLPAQNEVFVKAKYNRALWFWHRIMLHKPEHNKTHWNNFSYEIYNKLELDIDNINQKKLSNNFITKPFDFIFSFIDSTSEQKPFLPVFLTETLSDYYWQNSPFRTREIIKATKTNGIDNESLVKQLGGTYQNVNIYDNFIPVFDKNFVSPFNTNADNYYNFKLLDTQYLNKKRLVHLRFTAKRQGENTFDGDCWVNDTSFAVQKITMRPNVDANLNFITGLTVIQEFKLIDDTVWFLYKDKFVADIAPLGKNKLAFKARKTATYEHVVVDDTSVIHELDKSKVPQDIVLLPNVDNLSDSFWLKNRHEPLNKDEKTVYKVLDTLEKNKTYVHYRSALTFIGTGTKDVGNFTIGPYYYWLSGDNWEGTRMRFDLSTNTDFDKHWHFTGYGAYGFLDQKFKEKVEARYQFSHKLWSYVSLTYKNDLDFGQQYYDALSGGNLFATLFRRPNIPYKFEQLEYKKFEYYQETNKGFGFRFSAKSEQYDPLENLPGKQYFPTTVGDPLNSFETVFGIRYAYNERTLEQNFTRTSLGSDLPIVELTYTKGWPGVLRSSYNYSKLDFTISDWRNISPYGNLYYNFFAGKIFGTVPFPFLEIHPGNEVYFYNQFAFSLMNKYEYMSDKYAGFIIEHHIGSGLFRLTHFTRKLKFRQFWTAKGVIGDLSNENKQLNFVGNYPFQSLNGNWYMEVGTGIDNILKFFRVDFVWRVAPQPVPSGIDRTFGVFGSFTLDF